MGWGRGGVGSIFLEQAVVYPPYIYIQNCWEILVLYIAFHRT